ncbi:hypothetical protein PGTUg99_018529 [Puccinia graminis f. sp. tritici]|uniref:Uncharacterized protein n=1 Tax=Puccinia graminis f. sp. tritici TaxID=56615 RepID=A0A5B0SM59_PUCGR|nr:hypothetical protein PGTUg99_018529 [Puccinia graminis f. sp. tritici]
MATETSQLGLLFPCKVDPQADSRLRSWNPVPTRDNLPLESLSDFGGTNSCFLLTGRGPHRKLEQQAPPVRHNLISEQTKVRIIDKRALVGLTLICALNEVACERSGLE